VKSQKYGYNIWLSANMFSADIWVKEIIAGNLKDEAKIPLLPVSTTCVCNHIP